MTSKEEDRLAALTGLYRAKRRLWPIGAGCHAVQHGSRVSAAVAAVWSSGKFEVSSDWSQH